MTRSMVARLLAGTVLATLPGLASAITITTTDDSLALANTLFINTSNQSSNLGIPVQLQVQNAALRGASGQAGLYTNAAGTYGLPAQGIVLSTGNVADYQTGPNLTSSQSTSYSETPLVPPPFVEGPGGEFPGGEFPVVLSSFPGISPLALSSSLSPSDEELNDILSGITGQSDHFDAVSLDIEFFASAATTQVSFFAVFGSEEFPEYVNGGVNDGFGLLVNGINVASAGGGGQPINIDHPDFATFTGTELDGLLAPGGNPVLRFDVPVNPGDVNSLRVVLADAGDSVVDTTVYLSSFFAAPSGPASGTSEFDPLLPSNPPLPDGTFVIELPVTPPEATVWIDPPVSVGFSYTFTGLAPGDGVDFVTLPSLATVADLDGYTISALGSTFNVVAGQTFDIFANFGQYLTAFTIEGIDTSLSLDPADPLAFPLGVSFNALTLSGLTVDITPITQNVGTSPVPLPGAGWMAIMALLGLVGLRRGVPLA